MVALAASQQSKESGGEEEQTKSDSINPVTIISPICAVLGLLGAFIGWLTRKRMNLLDEIKEFDKEHANETYYKENHKEKVDEMISKSKALGAGRNGCIKSARIRIRRLQDAEDDHDELAKIKSDVSDHRDRELARTASELARVQQWPAHATPDYSNMSHVSSEDSTIEAGGGHATSAHQLHVSSLHNTAVGIPVYDNAGDRTLLRKESFRPDHQIHQWNSRAVAQFVASLDIDPTPFTKNSVQGKSLLEMDEDVLMNELGLTKLQSTAILRELSARARAAPESAV